MGPAHGYISGNIFNQRLHLIFQDKKAADVRVYKNRLIGSFLSLIGKAVKLEVAAGKTFYVNKNSLRKWTVAAFGGSSKSTDLSTRLNDGASKIFATKDPSIKFSAFDQSIQAAISLKPEETMPRSPKSAQPATPPAAPVPPPSSASPAISATTAVEFTPIASNEKDLPEGFFVQVLNSRKYIINGKTLSIPEAGKPQLVTFDLKRGTLEEQLVQLKVKPDVSGNERSMQVHVQDLTTEQAINERNGHAKIAVNFANEKYIGGPVPGFHRVPGTDTFEYDTRSATTQEESLCQRTDLMASLTQLPHDLDKIEKMVVSYYMNPDNTKKRMAFDSRKAAYITDNHLFAVQSKRTDNFFVSHYLEDSVQPVSFVTSAATWYGNGTVDCSPQSFDHCIGGLTVYKDAYQRIQTHLFAAATKAAEMHRQNPDQKIELVLGAYGCGVFAPKGNPNDYRRMIAGIYRDVVPKFHGFFDLVTYAVPTFRPRDDKPAQMNYQIFQEVLSKK